MEIEIKRANFNDLQDILKIQKNAFQYEAQIYQRNDLPALKQNLESIQTDFQKYDYYKATCKNELAGAVRSKTLNSSCVIERLMVSPKFQKKGVGRKLMDFVESNQQNIEKFELITGRKSLNNIQFYEKRGYKKIEEFYTEAGVDLVKMEKVL